MEYLQQVAVNIETVLKLLAHKGRFLVLCTLTQGERTAGELEDVAGLSQSALSQHLAKLREENIVCTRRDAQRIYYRLADEHTQAILLAIYRVFSSPTAIQNTQSSQNQDTQPLQSAESLSTSDEKAAQVEAWPSDSNVVSVTPYSNREASRPSAMDEPVNIDGQQPKTQHG